MSVFEQDLRCIWTIKRSGSLVELKSQIYRSVLFRFLIIDILEHNGFWKK